MSITPNAHEQLMLELINRARANPNAEVQRNPQVDTLNEGLATGTITTAAKQPLAFSVPLIDAARRHSQWMLDTDTFSHTGVNGSNPGQRMQAAGYSFTGNWTWGENISWAGTSGTPDVTKSVAQQHDGLFDSPGHRVNLMNTNFKEIGLGVLTGKFANWNAVMVTQKFARSGSNSFLTGVVYTDAIANDDFYTVGEGLGGITVRAIRQSDQRVFSTTTFGSGGYQIPLSAGTYTVEFLGGSLNQTVTRTVTMGDLNVKVDLATDQLATHPPMNPTPNPVINGTANNDSLTGGTASETINGLAGNDTIQAGAGNDSLHGGLGNDTLLGGDGNDTLIGANSSATNPGRGEIDSLNGGRGSDRFVLGNSSRVFYTDGTSAAGTTDYALIQNFRLTEGDVIQLRGSASNYVLGSAPNGLPTGTAIFLKASTNELIGVVQGATGLSLTSSAFSYV
jgi:uncharacterized protein YkwD